MKKIIFKIFLLFLTVALVTSCGPSVKVNSNYNKSADYTAYKTFSLQSPSTAGSVSPENVDHIVNSVRAEMTRKGFTEDNNDPDLLVNVTTILKTKQTFSATRNFRAFNGDIKTQIYWSQYGPSAGTVTVKTSKYKDGSLVINVQDASAKRSIWLGTGNAKIAKTLNNPEETISSAVAKIMASFTKADVNK